MAVAEALAIIGSIAATSKTLAETIEKVRGKGAKAKEAHAILTEAQELAISVRSGILDLQEKVLQLREEKADLQDQIRVVVKKSEELTDKLRAKESWATKREGYERRLMGQSTVMVEKESPEILLCPTCFEAERLAFLTRLGWDAEPIGTHLCPICKATFRTA